MEKKYQTLLILIAVFCFTVSILPGTFAAYWTGTFSADGKVLHISTNHVTSNLKTASKAVDKNGSYGYGTYGYVNFYGKDDKGRNVYRTSNYFNGVFKSGTDSVSCPGYWIKSSQSTVSTKKIVQTTKGAVSSTTFSGTMNFEYKIIGKDVILEKAYGSFNYWHKGVYQGKTTYTCLPVYKFLGNSFQMIKTTDQYNTQYQNGDTRTSIISTNYRRGSEGKLLGKKSTGKSRGTEKVNGKLVKYTGIIQSLYRYDPRDTWYEKFTFSSYQETRTSSSTKLIKRLPLIEAII